MALCTRHDLEYEIVRFFINGQSFDRWKTANEGIDHLFYCFPYYFLIVGGRIFHLDYKTLELLHWILIVMIYIYKLTCLFCIWNLVKKFFFFSVSEFG